MLHQPTVCCWLWFATLLYVKEQFLCWLPLVVVSLLLLLLQQKNKTSDKLQT